MPALRICHIGRAEKAGSTWQRLERASELGFDTILAEPGVAGDAFATLARACKSRGLSLFFDLNLFELDMHHALVVRYPESFAIRRRGEPGEVVDPRHPSPGRGQACLRETSDPTPLIDWWADQIGGWLKAGVRGFRMVKPASTNTSVREGVVQHAAHQGSNRVTFIADTTGEPWDRVAALKGFDLCLSSLPWWG